MISCFAVGLVYRVPKAVFVSFSSFPRWLTKPSAEQHVSNARPYASKVGSICIYIKEKQKRRGGLPWIILLASTEKSTKVAKFSTVQFWLVYVLVGSGKFQPFVRGKVSTNVSKCSTCVLAKKKVFHMCPERSRIKRYLWWSVRKNKFNVLKKYSLRSII